MTEPARPPAPAPALAPETFLGIEEAGHRNLDVAVRPLIEHLRMNYEASTKFAQEAIRSGFVLNGGALILLSGFATLFKVNPTLIVGDIVVTTSAFIGGLMAACFTCFFAYRNARSQVDIANHRIAGTTLTHLSASFTDPRVKSQYDAAAKLQTRATRDAKWAVIAGAVSLVAFMCGAVIGGWTLMAHAGSA